MQAGAKKIVCLGQLQVLDARLPRRVHRRPDSGRWLPRKVVADCQGHGGLRHQSHRVGRTGPTVTASAQADVVVMPFRRRRKIQGCDCENKSLQLCYYYTQ